MGAGGIAAMGNTAVVSGAAASPMTAATRASMASAPSCVVRLSSSAAPSAADAGAAAYESLSASFRTPGVAAQHRAAGMNAMAIDAIDRSLACTNDQIVIALLMLMLQQQGAARPHGFLSNGGA